MFSVFSINAPPFEDGRGYSLFAVYSLLKHDGDFVAAARALRREGFGAEPASGDVDLSAFKVTSPQAEPPPSTPIDPGPVPPALLRVPGFIDEVIDYTLANAPYPEPVLAFCGAVALQAALAGRKVRDPQDNRTAIYLLGLATPRTGTGKDFPRKVHQRILASAGMAGHTHHAATVGPADGVWPPRGNDHAPHAATVAAATSLHGPGTPRVLTQRSR